METQTNQPTVQELKEQLAEVEAQLTVARKAERKAALAQIQELMAEFDIKEVTLKAGTKKHGTGTKRGPVAPKYQCPETGATWSGRGRTPVWFNEDTVIRL